MDVFRRIVEPRLADYMGRFIFETVCAQWLQRRAFTELDIQLLDLGRWWSRDSQVEIDLIGPLDGGGTLFGECKWSVGAAVDVDVLTRLQGKVARIPKPGWLTDPQYVLFSVGGFSDRLRSIAASDGRVHLVEGTMLF